MNRIMTRRDYASHNNYNYGNLINSIIIGDPSVKHKYTTSKRQLNRLENILEDYSLVPTLNLREWYYVHSAVKYCFFSDVKSYENQRQRAYLVVLQAILNKNKSLVYLDGHGRMTYCIIEQIILFEEEYHERLDLQLICVEWEEDMYDWHKLLFSKDIRVIHDDILDYVSDMSESEKEQTLVYFNFCGLQGQLSEIIEAIMDLRRYNQVFFSFSTRCGCQLSNKDYHECHLEEFMDFIRYIKGHLVNKKHNFQTYKFTQGGIFIDL